MIPITVKLNSFEWKNSIIPLLQQAIQTNSLAIFFGSAISQFEPTNIPTGSSLSKKFVSHSLRDLQHYGDLRNIRRGILDVPFEIFMTRLVEITDYKTAEKLVNSLTSLSKTNPIHRQIANFARERIVVGGNLDIITPNYDLGIELGIKQSLQCYKTIPESEHFGVIVTEEDVIRSHSKAIRLFKVHGSNDVPGSLVLDHEREFNLPNWKSQYLRNSMVDKILLVIGYSGWDLDISEALCDCGISHVIWCCKDENSIRYSKWSLGAKQLITSARSYIINLDDDIQGAMEALSPKVGKIQFSPKKIEQNIERSIKTLPKDIPKAWHAWTVLRAGYGQVGLNAIKLIKTSVSISKARQLEYESTCFFYKGQHARAGHIMRKAVAATGKDFVSKIYFRAGEIACWNRGQFSIQAIKGITRGLLESCLVLFNAKTRRKLPYLVIQIISQSKEIWPLQQISLLAKPISSLFAFLDRQVGFADDYAPAVKAARLMDVVKWHYTWLGQRARLINIYRIEAKESLEQYYMTCNESFLSKGIRKAMHAALLSNLVNDPARLGKCCLLLAELALTAESSNIPNIILHSKDLGIYGTNWEDISVEYAKLGWKLIKKSEIWSFTVFPSFWLYTFVHNRFQVNIGKKFRNKLLALSFRWSGA